MTRSRTIEDFRAASAVVLPSMLLCDFGNLEQEVRALEAAGAHLSDVVRTRILLTRIEDWQQVARVHGEFFRAIRPANTVMQVSRFIDPEWLVEVEADAVVEE